MVLHVPNQVYNIRMVLPECLLGKGHKLGSEISQSQCKEENTSSSIKLLYLKGKDWLNGSGQAQILGREQGTSHRGLGSRTTNCPHLPLDSGECQDVCLSLLKPGQLRQPRGSW